MDGVLIHEGSLIPGAEEFIRRLGSAQRAFLVLTNNSIYTPRDLRARLAHAGIDVPESAIWTSALATALPLRALEGRRLDRRPDRRDLTLSRGGKCSPRAARSPDRC
jgi:NagD protein